MSKEGGEVSVMTATSISLDGGLGGAAAVSGPQLDLGPTFAVAPPSPGGFNGTGEYLDQTVLTDFKPSVLGPQLEYVFSPSPGGEAADPSALENNLLLYMRKPDTAGKLEAVGVLENEQVKSGSPAPASSIEIDPPARRIDVESGEPGMTGTLWVPEEIRKKKTGILGQVMEKIQETALAGINKYFQAAESMVRVIGVGYDTGSALAPALQTATRTKLSTLAKAEVAPQIRTKTANLTFPEPKTAQRAMMTEAVTEKTNEISTKQKVEEKPIKPKKKYVLDEKALDIVIKEYLEAAAKAAKFASAWGLRLTGAVVNSFIPGQNEDNESEIVKGIGPDGSIPERKDTIRGWGEFDSAEAAGKRLIEEAYEKPPVKSRQEGQDVKDEDVARVQKYLVFKRKIEEPLRSSFGDTLISKAGGSVSEAKIEDYSALAEVFPKAA